MRICGQLFWNLKSGIMDIAILFLGSQKWPKAWNCWVTYSELGCAGFWLQKNWWSVRSLTVVCLISQLKAYNKILHKYVRRDIGNAVLNSVLIHIWFALPSFKVWSEFREPSVLHCTDSQRMTCQSQSSLCQSIPCSVYFTLNGTTIYKMNIMLYGRRLQTSVWH